MGAQRRLLRFVIAAIIFVLFVLQISRLLPWSLIDNLERATYDARVLLTMPGTVDPQVVIIDLDEKSITAEGHWPWPRDKFAALVNQAFDRYQLRTLALDINFPEADTRSSGLDALNQLSKGAFADLPGFADRLQSIRPTLDHEAQFASALKGRSVVMGYVFKDANAPSGAASIGHIPAPLIDARTAAGYQVGFYENNAFTGNLPVLQAAAASAGYFDNSLGLDIDGVFRRIPLLQRYQGALYPSLALETVRIALGAPPLQLEFDPPEQRDALHLEALVMGQVRIPVDERVQAFVPYRGRWPSFTYISATEVIRGTADPALLRGKVALLGTSAPGLLDLRVTPVGQAYPGVEVHANLISGMLDGRIPHKPAYYEGLHVLMLLLIAVVLAYAAPKLSPLSSGLLVMTIIAGLNALAFAAWNAHFILPLGTPVLFTVLLFLLLTFYGYFVENRKVRQVSKQFGEYIPPELVDELAANPAAASMEGDKRQMTVLFSDVRDFTSISEKLDSKELSTLMNQFLTPLTQVIQQHRGTIDKYMGDAIMAFWGAPLRDEEHASHALQAGMAMLDAVRSLDAAFEARGWPKLRIGVGLNTGDMTVGNMGSAFRRAYTVLGDAVNLGSRLESLTKEYGVAFIVAEATRQAGPKDWAYRELDFVRVKGKTEPVAIHEPLGPRDKLDAALRDDLIRHRAAMKLYRNQQWDQAEIELFNLSRSGRPHRVYEIFLARIASLRANPPGPDWDGAFVATHK